MRDGYRGLAIVAQRVVEAPDEEAIGDAGEEQWFRERVEVGQEQGEDSVGGLLRKSTEGLVAKVCAGGVEDRDKGGVTSDRDVGKYDGAFE